MRVRHLQSHLQEQRLVNAGKIDQLRRVKMGVDAVFWLRSIHALKDPFADALGGIPPGIFGSVDKELDWFKRFDIHPVFVFQGVAPGPQHSMFVSRMDQQMELAWTYLGKGQKSEAQKCFAVSTSRINGDFVYFILHHLRHRGYDCIQAPYFAGAQLAHFMEQGVVETVLGPPGVLLYGVPSAIIHVNFQQATFDWVELRDVLEKWGISKDQFADACMMAGTEYCLSFPYLPMPNNAVDQGRFNFDAAVNVVKQAPLLNWMSSFPTEDMRIEHQDGYSICKLLIENAPILHVLDNTIRPLGYGQPGESAPQVPADFGNIMGDKLPNSLYYLILYGIISHKLPQALAKGEWTDKTQPLVETSEFRTLLEELSDYRQKALGLMAQRLQPSFQQKRILCKAFYESVSIRQRLCGNEARWPMEARVLVPNVPTEGLRWNIQHEAVLAEMQRQGIDTVDFKFCLTWHRNEFQTNGPLFSELQRTGDPSCGSSVEALGALVHFMVLEHLDLIDGSDGSMTVLGDVLADTPQCFQEPAMVALELMKFGILSGEPFDAPNPERPFPDQVAYPRAPLDQRNKSKLLLCRVMSLIPMKLKNDMWNADVDFDLAAFHSLVRILKRSLRQITEGALANVLLKDMRQVRLLPAGFMCASPNKEDHMQSAAMLPTFMLPRACMGIVVKHFLEFKSDGERYQNTLGLKFPCCEQPIKDLKMAVEFWKDLKRCINRIAQQLEGAEEIMQDMAIATQMLEDQVRRLRL